MTFRVTRGRRYSPAVFARRHRLEQYFTSLHTKAHFFRQANGRPHVTQTFVGKSAFFSIDDPF